MPRNLLLLMVVGTAHLMHGHREVHAAHEWTLAEVRDKVDDARSRIRSIYFEADLSGRMATTPKGTFRRQHLIFAAKGERRFHEAGHFLDTLLWNEDPSWVRHYLLAERIDVVWPLFRIARRSQSDSNPALNAKLVNIYYEPYLESIGYWPPDSSPERTNLIPEFCLCRIVRHPKCQLLPGTVMIDGRPCVTLHVVDRGEYVYLDPSRGAILVRRRIRLPDGAQAVFENHDFCEVGPGTWLPRDARQAVFRGEFKSIDEVPEAAIGILNKYLLSRIEINHVEDNQFIYQPLPGTIIFERDENRVSFVPGGTDLIDGVSRTARKRIDPRSKSPGESPIQMVAVPLLILMLAMPPWLMRVWRWYRLPR